MKNIKHLLLLGIVLGISLIEVHGSQKDNALFLDLKIDDRKKPQGQLQRTNHIQQTITYYAPWVNIYDNDIHNPNNAHTLYSFEAERDFNHIQFNEEKNITIYQTVIDIIFDKYSKFSSDWLIRNVDITLSDNTLKSHFNKPSKQQYPVNHEYYGILKETPVEKVINKCSIIIITIIQKSIPSNNFSENINTQRISYIINFRDKKISKTLQKFTPSKFTCEAFAKLKPGKSSYFTTRNLTLLALLAGGATMYYTKTSPKDLITKLWSLACATRKAFSKK